MKLRKKQWGFIGGGIVQHTHSSGSSGGDVLQHLPAGAYVDFCGTVLPTGFLACDGAAVSRTTYARLFAAIGTTWGVGDGATTFNVPDFRRRGTVGNGGTGTAQLGNAVGNVGGAETITLTTLELASHPHVERFSTAAGGTGMQEKGGFGTGPLNSNESTDVAGGGGAHNNYQPVAVDMKIIKT